MPFCVHCGLSMQNNQDVCLYCGKVNRQAKSIQENNAAPLGWALVGFFVPLAGILLFFIWRVERPKDAKGAGIGALISISITIIIVILYFFFIIMMIVRFPNFDHIASMQ